MEVSHRRAESLTGGVQSDQRGPGLADIGLGVDLAGYPWK